MPRYLAFASISFDVDWDAYLMSEAALGLGAVGLVAVAFGYRKLRYHAYYRKLSTDLLVNDIIPSSRFTNDLMKVTRNVSQTVLTHPPEHVSVKYEKTQTKRALVAFYREVSILKVLSHSCIPEYKGVIFTPYPAIVYEYVKGASLSEMRHRLDLRSGLLVLLQVAQCLSYLHARKICHRDVKSANVVVNMGQGDGFVGAHLIDFGSARMTLKGDQSLVGKVGTAGYMAPEILRGLAHGVKTDIYSFGILMHEVVSKADPWESCSQYEEEDVTMGLRPDIPDTVPLRLARLIRACWAPKPDLRPDAKEVVTRLEKEFALFNIRDFA